MFRPIEDDGDPDLALYNEELKARGPTTWHNVEWLYGECYLYRRIGALFKCTQRWKDYDVFAQQKQSAFKSSIVAVVELAAKYRDIIQTSRERASEHTEDDREAEERERLLFIEMCEICLWGNATDLSLLRDLSYDDIQKLQGSKAREESEKNILVSDLDDAFQRLRAAKTSNSSSQVTFVLDNAGFELLVDMILAGFLLDRRLATKVVFQSKSMPWFVSDVVPKDFADLLNALAEPEAFFASGDGYTNSETSKTVLTENQLVDLKFMFENFATLHGEGKLILKSDRFWTQPGSFWRMPHTAPELFHDLQQCQLVVFKGDLNYRKLTGDVSATQLVILLACTTSFMTVLTDLSLLILTSIVSPRHNGHPPPPSPAVLAR